ncbi:unnamed protein product [Lathyrus oleraceus]|uniref:Apple domain-containing protein n=1 Tax=Pisum sativum TaxID=3888 RepID=A0A9D5ADR5_PEA|nr:uncharacterized protein LOC127088165 [Pisum sativum]KAI5404363.1 hypothetical protein KIW84_051502 [Pisum sativum]
MARGKCFWISSYNNTTLFLCFFNLAIVALFVFHSLYASLSIHSTNVSHKVVVSYSPDQIWKMEESVQIREASIPVELVKSVKALEREFSIENLVVELPRNIKQKIVDEILHRLRSLNSNSTDIAKEREVIESWRKEKLKEVRLTHVKGNSNYTISLEETGMLLRALESDWDVLCKEVGLWIPAQLVNEEHDDNPEGREDIEEEVLPGRTLPSECHAELHTDYDGTAVRWGLTHHKDSAAECCEACLDLARQGEKKCNIWVYCPSEFGCYSPDIYQHKHQECWLKYDERPQLNFKDKYPESYQNSYPAAPIVVPWVSGVVSL